MYTSMGWGVYVFFATCLVCASVFAFFFIYDTKGMRVDQMDELFGFERMHQTGAPVAKAFEVNEHEDTKVAVDQKEIV